MFTSALRLSGDINQEALSQNPRTHSDDTPFSIFHVINVTKQRRQLQRCLWDVDAWIRHNRLTLKCSKMELVFYVTKQKLTVVDSTHVTVGIVSNSNIVATTSDTQPRGQAFGPLAAVLKFGQFRSLLVVPVHHHPSSLEGMEAATCSIHTFVLLCMKRPQLAQSLYLWGADQDTSGLSRPTQLNLSEVCNVLAWRLVSRLPSCTSSLSCIQIIINFYGAYIPRNLSSEA